MKKFEKPTVEIYHFECSDIITTSGEEHDNGYVDSGTLPYSLKEPKIKVY